MPIYEYRCTACAHGFEVSQRMSDDALTECEVCGGRLAKVLFAPAIHFKGTGFHNTDYASRRRGGEDGSKEGGESAGAKEGAGAAGENGAKAGADKNGGAKKESSSSDAGGSGKKTVGLDKV